MSDQVVNQKSYNPFKMWGSWVGGGIGLLFTIFLIYVDTRFIASKNIIFLSGLIISPFLLGWVIHSLIRGIKDSYKIESRREYNPLKMIGSWIGLSIILFPLFLGDIISFDKILSLNPLALWEWSWCDDAGCGFVSLISTPIIYFFYGWAIHSLVRKHKK